MADVKSAPPSPGAPAGGSKSGAAGGSAGGSPGTSSAENSDEDDKSDDDKKMDDRKAQSSAGVGDANEKKSKFRKGDYSVQVRIMEARELKGRDAGDTSDPVCIVTVGKKKEHTKTQKKQLNPVWDESLYFEIPDALPNELETTKINIAVYDANTLSRDVLIGAYQFDLSTVYYKPYHEVFRQWVALIDTTQQFQGIQGYLRCSIVVLGPDDEQHTHTKEEEDDDSGGMMSLLLPPQIEQIGYLLRVRCYSADGLPRMNNKNLGLGTMADPYVAVEFGGQIMKTKKGKGIKWDFNEELCIPVMEPVMSSTIKVSVWDWDRLSKDDLISCFTVDYSELKKASDAVEAAAPAAGGNVGGPAVSSTKDQLIKWFNLYGAPRGRQRGKASKRMNQGSLTGSFNRGKVLLGFSVSRMDDPKKSQGPCPPLSLTTGLPNMIKYAVQFDVYEGSEIPESQRDLYVELGIGNWWDATPIVPVIEGRCQWYAVSKPDQLISNPLTLPSDVSQCPDIYVYLSTKKHKRFSFWRIPFATQMAKGWKQPPSWHILTECTARDVLKTNEFPGAVLLSLRVGPATQCPAIVPYECRPLALERADVPDEPVRAAGVDEKSIVPFSAVPPPPPQFKSVGGKRSRIATVKITVIEARNCPPISDSASAATGKDTDPYASLKIGAVKFRTTVKKDTLNPVWNETITFKDVRLERDSLTIKIVDHNFFKNKPMGQTDIDLKNVQISAGRVSPQDLKWSHQMTINFNDKYPTAIVLLRFDFEFLPIEQSEELMKKDRDAISQQLQSLFKGKGAIMSELGRPSFAQFQLRVHLFQARNLPATDENGLCDAYVIVRCCGKTLKFDKVMETRNPSWFQTQVINVSLPVPLTLAPHLQLFIYDWNRVGRDVPIGRFMIPITDALDMNPGVGNVRPRWFELVTWENKPIDGAQCLASFELLTPGEVEAAGSTLPSIIPPTKPMRVTITTLGCRDLTSFLGIHKTYLQFELPSGRRLKTEPSSLPSAKSPNFLQVLTAPIKLPLDKIYAPSIDIEVKDTLFGGVVKRVVGASSVDLGQFLKEDAKGRWTVLNADDADIVPVVGDEASEKDARDNAARKKRGKKLLASAIEAEAKNKAEQKKRADAEKEQADILKKALGSLAENETDTKTAAAAPDVKVEIQDEKDEKKSESAPAAAAAPSGKDTLKTPLLDKDSKSDGKDPLLDIKLDVKPSAEEKQQHDKEREMDDMASGGKGGDDDESKKPLLAGGFGLSSGKGGKAVDMAKERAAFAALDKPPATFDALKETGDEHGDEEEKPEYMKGRLEVDTDLESFMFIQPFLTVDLYTGVVGSLIDKYRKVGKYKGFIRLKDPHADEVVSPTAAGGATIAEIPDGSAANTTATGATIAQLPATPGAAPAVDTKSHVPGAGLAPVAEDDEPAFGQQIKKKTGLKNFLKKGLDKGMNKMLHRPDKAKPKTEHDKKEEELMGELLTPKEYFLRLYVLRGRGLIPTDSDGTADPYLLVKVGKHKIDTRDRHLKKTLDPDFYESFEVPVLIPGDAKLTIDVIDASAGLSISDDLIGRTEIDIEDRWFSKEWRALPMKPLERRLLHNPKSTHGQGKLECWIELLSVQEAKSSAMWMIKPAPPDPYELRVIIWKVQKVVQKDAPPEVIDLYVSSGVSIAGVKGQETDTHFRARSCTGSFNWRMKYPILLPPTTNGSWPRLRLCVWDKELLSSNDSICETMLSLKGICKRAMKIKDRLKVVMKGQDKFVLKGLRHPNHPKATAEIEMSLELMPLTVANQLPAGLGRGDPNTNPHLPEPEGRMRLSLFHPFDMLKDLIGSSAYHKICCCCCLMVTIVLLVLLAPFFQTMKSISSAF